MVTESGSVQAVVVLDLSAQYDTTQSPSDAVTVGVRRELVVATKIALAKSTDGVASVPV